MIQFTEDPDEKPVRSTNLSPINIRDSLNSTEWVKRSRKGSTDKVAEGKTEKMKADASFKVK